MADVFRTPFFAACLAAALLLLSAAPVRAENPMPDANSPALIPATEELAKSYLLGRSLIIGGALSQDTISLSRTGDSATLTNGVTPGLVIALNSETTPVGSWPLRDRGAVTLGYDFTATGSYFTPDRLLVNDATSGTDVGTRARAGFIAVAPRATLIMGPLYASGPDIGWKCTLGLGLALMHFAGNATFYGSDSSGTHTIDSGAALPAGYIETRLIMNFGHWDGIFTGQYLGSARQGYAVKYTIYSAGLAYQFSLF